MRHIQEKMTMVCLILLICCWLPLSAKGSGKPELKNIIIISVDTLRADHLGCYGYPLNTTPVIDGLAHDGVLFSRCYTLTPLTTPSFSTLLSGLPPHKHGAKRNGLSVFRDIKTLPYYLKRYGYRSTAIISNWPLRKKLAGLHQHFDTYHEVFNKKRWMGMINTEGIAPKVTLKAVEWLEENHGKRFFLWVQYTDPHAPYIRHKEHKFSYKELPKSTYPPGTRMKKIERYDSEIAYTDYHIKAFLDKLKELGLYKDSLIILNGDHGESFGEHNYFRHGRKLYNSTLHVPLIVKLPGNEGAGTRRGENVCMLDVMPTVFDALGFSHFPKQLEGVPLFDDERKGTKRKILLQTYGGTVILKRGSYKYHLKVKPTRYGILDGNTKLIYNLKNKTYEAYNLADDRFETKNVYVVDPGQLPELPALKSAVLEKTSRVTEFIKMNRKRHLNDTSLSKEDMEKLKSLGYIDD